MDAIVLRHLQVSQVKERTNLVVFLDLVFRDTAKQRHVSMTHNMHSNHFVKIPFRDQRSERQKRESLKVKYERIVFFT